MILQCPNCGSVRVHARHDARKACGAAGTVVGMAGGAATGVSRAQTGIALGATAGAAGTAMSLLLGGLAGGLFGVRHALGEARNLSLQPLDQLPLRRDGPVQILNRLVLMDHTHFKLVEAG